MKRFLLLVGVAAVAAAMYVAASPASQQSKGPTLKQFNALKKQVATLNKTLKSLALAKIGAEYVLNWLPRGTHDWNRFISPQELQRSLKECGLTILKTQGVSFDPLNWDWKLSSDVDVNYMIVARR